MDLSGGPVLARRLQRPKVDAPAVEVLCDESGFVGSLSYKVPAKMELRVGDAVRVPFGKQERYGMVVGPGDAKLATREVLECFGPRTGEVEIALAASLAAEQFSTFESIAPRLAPRTKRGNPALIAPAPRLRKGASRADYALADVHPKRTILALAPGIDPVRATALEALRLSANGQVLILAPTKRDVSRLLAEFECGAARMDEVPKKDEPSPWRGFLEGSLPVAISTRAAALWPAHDLAGIVVFDEDHPGFKESAQPYTNARDVAIRRTAASDVDLVLIASNPSLSALASRSKLVQAGLQSHWPEVRLVAKNDLDPMVRNSPPLAASAVASALRVRAGAYVLAPSASTRHRCRACSMAYESDVSSCLRCGGEVVRAGLGPDRVSQLFPKATVLTFPELLSAKPRPGSTVVLLDVDSLASAPDLEPGATAAAALLAAARLAGPGGTVVACANDNPPEVVIDLLVKRDIRRHAKRVWGLAKEMQLPPFVRMVECRFNRRTAPSAPSLGCKVLGPKKVAEDEWELRLLLPPDRLASLKPWVESLRRRGKCRISVV